MSRLALFGETSPPPKLSILNIPLEEAIDSHNLPCPRFLNLMPLQNISTIYSIELSGSMIGSSYQSAPQYHHPSWSANPVFSLRSLADYFGSCMESQLVDGPQMAYRAFS